MTLYWICKVFYVPCWRHGDKVHLKTKLEVAIQGSDLILDVFVLETFLLEPYSSNQPFTSSCEVVIKYVNCIYVRHTFQKSLFFHGSMSSAYVFNLLSYLMWCYRQLKLTTHVTNGISYWIKFHTGVPRHTIIIMRFSYVELVDLF